MTDSYRLRIGSVYTSGLFVGLAVSHVKGTRRIPILPRDTGEEMGNKSCEAYPKSVNGAKTPIIQRRKQREQQLPR
jgi:hypothetical protein